MAIITNYIADNTRPGSKENIWVQIVFFINVGSGEVIEISSFKFSFRGKIDTLFYKGDLNIAAELTDHNEGAQSGPCLVSVNGIADEHAHYHVQGNKLVLDCNFAGVKQSITMYKIEKGKQTALDLSGKYSYAVHLSPA